MLAHQDVVTAGLSDRWIRSSEQVNNAAVEQSKVFASTDATAAKAGRDVGFSFLPLLGRQWNMAALHLEWTDFERHRQDANATFKRLKSGVLLTGFA
jgi:hypothetical protein